MFTFVQLIVISNTAIDMSRNNELSKLWKGPRFFWRVLRLHARFGKYTRVSTNCTQSLRFFRYWYNSKFLIGIIHMENFKITRVSRYKVHVYYFFLFFFFNKEVRIRVIYESIHSNPPKLFQSISETKIRLFRLTPITSRFFALLSLRSATKHPFNHPVHLNSSKKQGYSIVQPILAIISGINFDEGNGLLFNETPGVLLPADPDELRK